MGGTERIVDALVGELIAEGHEVTLLGEDSSSPRSGLRFEGIGTYRTQKSSFKKVWKFLLSNGGDFDVIHNHGRLLFFMPTIWSRVAKVHTFHFGELVVPQVRRFVALKPRNFAFAPCGRWIADQYSGLGGRWTSIPNGIPRDSYRPSFDVTSDAPLVAIGRMDPRKGFPMAIRIARSAGRRLIIAGVVGDLPHEKEWFETNVLRHCDGSEIVYVGPVTDSEKQALLASAAGLILPIQGSEAFTVVMLEAIAAGCPVIGLDRYCIPELVIDGFNGFLGSSEAELVEKVRRIEEISRRDVRADFERRFTAAVMAKAYLDLYAELRS
jgi:glycosyltransferase involved in cell wall biosynthesis